MVSIHRVPVIAYLIIRVIYFTFRFKCGADFRLSYRRLWKDLVENKRHNTPHSDRYGGTGTQNATCHRYLYEVSVVPSHPFY